MDNKINLRGLSRYFPPPGRRSARIVDSLDVGESAEVSEERVLAAGLLHVLLEDRVRPRHHELALVSMPIQLKVPTCLRSEYATHLLNVE